MFAYIHMPAQYHNKSLARVIDQKPCRKRIVTVQPRIVNVVQCIFTTAKEAPHQHYHSTCTEHISIILVSTSLAAAQLYVQLKGKKGNTVTVDADFFPNIFFVPNFNLQPPDGSPPLLLPVSTTNEIRRLSSNRPVAERSSSLM